MNFLNDSWAKMGEKEEIVVLVNTNQPF